MLISYRYTPEERAQIAKYACMHGVHAASIHFSKEYRSKISPSTIRSIKLAYLNHMRSRREVSPDRPITSLPPKKRGRPLLLGNKIDDQLQLYLRKVREQGGIITASVVVAAARGLLMSLDHTMVLEHGGHVNLTRQWAYHFLGRMKFVRRKATTSKSKFSPADFEALKKSFLDEVSQVVEMEEIPPELVLNWDQTGINLVPASGWMMEQ